MQQVAGGVGRLNLSSATDRNPNRFGERPSTSCTGFSLGLEASPQLVRLVCRPVVSPCSQM
jgi:hypothetical protein